jgi:hypothetical protein
MIPLNYAHQPVVTQFEIWRYFRTSQNLLKSIANKDSAFAGTAKMSHYRRQACVSRASTVEAWQAARRGSRA